MGVNTGLTQTTEDPVENMPLMTVLRPSRFLKGLNLRLTQVHTHSLARKTRNQNNLRLVFLCVSRAGETQNPHGNGFGEG
jgi:hypothetical protein